MSRRDDAVTEAGAQDGQEPVPGFATDSEPLGLKLEEAERFQRQQAVRRLLMRPLLAARGRHSDTFVLVRRHAEWLREWFLLNTGWALVVGADVARLRKSPGELGDTTRPARDPASGTPFNRRRYTVFCLALAFLEREERQTTLGSMAARLEEWAHTDPGLSAAGFDFQLDLFEHRRDLVQVVRLLLDLELLRRVQGDEQRYVESKADVLYNIDRAALAAVPIVQKGPSTIATPDPEARLRELSEELLPLTPEGRNRQLRWRLTRRLLDDPVVYLDELSDNERAYLSSQRPALVGQVREATGLVPELRAEGLAMVDPDLSATDEMLPEEGTDGHLALLLSEYLAQRIGTTVPLAELHRQTLKLVAEHRSYWRQDASLDGAEKVLVRQTLERLEALRLVRRTAAGTVPLAAIARYGLAPPNQPRPARRRKPGRRRS